MAKGSSGRIVIEVDPCLKKKIYAKLALEGKNLKQWFVEQAEGYVLEPHEKDKRSE
ncbi:hypothetical protein [Desulfobaculum bizertense]|uniref:Uncharacterized protein n=1 Tax=Desulfobaculum bizertense DSM 18034 TaxID=1121442 RepID=A0A1T4W0X6_9BACT|nr:hypothetical protein [Desulfobaculum bizertense]SKA70900.1 hypothetical protein SAMN02745702_01363 [Desulfobaculum bizertense DSM 18034]